MQTGMSCDTAVQIGILAARYPDGYSLLLTWQGSTHTFIVAVLGRDGTNLGTYEVDGSGIYPG